MSKEKEKEEKMRLDAIIEYQLDELESRAYKILSLWVERSRKLFPNYRHASMKKGDPRKSLIFKICYKLVRETQGVLEESDYNLYVRAQLEILKHINNGKIEPLIDPHCLVGEKAWKRWKLWKKKYDTLSANPLKQTSETVVTQTGVLKAIQGLERTKEFLAKTFSGDLSYEKFNEAFLNNNLFRWISWNKISPYYVVISPFLKKILKNDDYKKIDFDLEIYKPYINDDVMIKFYELFPLEK
jgi:hypothetical protein